jgi:hypothetical protein
MEELDWQIIINFFFGIITFLGGWMLKLIFGLMSKMQEDYKDLNHYSRVQHDKLIDDLTALALSIPEKYVSKDDFNQLVKAVHHRFDRLEEKIDSLKNHE